MSTDRDWREAQLKEFEENAVRIARIDRLLRTSHIVRRTGLAFAVGLLFGVLVTAFIMRDYANMQSRKAVAEALGSPPTTRSK